MPEGNAGEGKIREWLIGGVAILMIAYHLWTVWFPTFNAILHQNIHLGFSLVLLFLVAMRARKRGGAWPFVLGLIASLIVVVYMHAEYERLRMWAGFPEVRDIFIGIALVGLVIYLTWRNWGAIFPILVGISIAYALFGHHIRGALGHPPFDPKLVLSNLGIGFEGTYGMMLNASANLIFLFIIFGSVFEAVGIDKFFIEIGNFLGRYLRGGAAQTAVFSSSFVGMCTGAAAANVALTGSYTIPLMKRCGFRGRQAGAIEAVASTGGQLTPPVMGVAIFLMASFLGVSYANLMATALIPAVGYYLIAMFGVILIASRDRLPMLTARIDGSVLVRGAPLFVIPMGLVTYLLVRRYSPAYAAFFAIFALLAISLIRKKTRPSLKALTSGLIRGATMGATIAVACAMIGMFTKMLTFTGAGPKLAGVIQVLSGGHLIVALVLTMMLAILLGCAMPTPVAYVVAALVVSPVLVDMGLDRMVAHFFVFYFAILSAVTPPVAGAALVGSRIANAGYLVTGWESLKLTAPFFLVPYFIARNPIILSKSQPVLDALLALVALAVACASFLIFCQGFCFRKVHPVERVLFLAVSLLGVAYGLYGGAATLLASVILLTILLAFQWRGRAKTRAAQTAQAPA